MEFILISEDKIKVTLSEADLEEFDLVADELDYANTETKRMFWDVLSRAKARTGFDTDGQKVLVQLYPSKDGGCEIFVTKIGSIYKELCEEPIEECSRPITSESSAIKRKRKSTAAERRHSTVYSFSSLGDMIRVCRELARRGYSEESLAYISDTEIFYLVLRASESTDIRERYPFITEFGDEEHSRAAHRILSEHADVITRQDAVATLSLC